MASADQSQGAGSNGWPLGLEPFHLRLRLMDHIRLSRSSFLFSTPSVTPASSSDLDTESSGSFFPERSTTLGSLIGIQASARRGREGACDAMAQQFLSPAGKLPSKRQRNGSSCCCLFASSSSGAAKEGQGPSLAHLLELERGSPMGQGQGRRGEDEGVAANTLFDAGGILPPQSCGAPLRLVLQQQQQGSPASSYLSADWSSSATAFHSTLVNSPRSAHGNSPHRIVGCLKKLRLH